MSNTYNSESGMPKMNILVFESHRHQLGSQRYNIPLSEYNAAINITIVMINVRISNLTSSGSVLGKRRFLTSSLIWSLRNLRITSDVAILALVSMSTMISGRIAQESNTRLDI